MTRFTGLVCICALLAGCTKLVDPDNVVVATVDGEKLRISDVLERISQTPPDRRLDANTAEGRQKILDDLINETMLLQAAAAASLTVTEEEIDARLSEQRPGARSGGSLGQEAVLQVMPDPEVIRRIMLIERVAAPHLSQDKVEARYAERTAGPPQITVQYEFFKLLGSAPNLGMDVQRQMQEGAEVSRLIAQYQSHPAFVSGGTAEPLLARFLEPWLQREISRYGEGAVLPPWQTTTSGQPTIELIRVLNVWQQPPLEVMYPFIVEELYAELLDNQKAQHTIELFPERLSLIDRR